MAAINGQRYLLFDQRKKPESDNRVVETGDNRGRAVDQLETEPEINQHSGQRVQGRQQSLLLQLHADLRPDDLHVADAKVGGKESLLQAGNNRGGSDIAHVGDSFEDPAQALVAVIYDGPRQLPVALRHASSPRAADPCPQILQQRAIATLFISLLAGLGLGLKARTDRVLTLVESLLAGLFQIQRISTSLLPEAP